MPLFDIIKDPGGADAAVTVVVTHEESVEAEPTTPPELELLREAAREADARDTVEPEYPMDASAERFLELCLAMAHQMSVQPYRRDIDIEDGFRSALLRIVGVNVLTGTWSMVLNARESALATVAELARRGFGSPQHDYRRVDGAWVLRIRFSY